MKHVARTVTLWGGCAALFLASPALAWDEVSREPHTSGVTPYGRVCDCTVDPSCVCPDDAGTDAGVDAGTEQDAGVDAGPEPDAGVVEQDAGTPDAGPRQPEADGGSPPDAGQQQDTITYIGGGCACGGGTSAALTFGMLGGVLVLARRRSQRR